MIVTGIFDLLEISMGAWDFYATHLLDVIVVGYQ